VPYGGGRVINVNQNQTVTGADFAATPPGSINGHAFYDQDQDGSIDVGDAPLVGYTVFIDLNLNGLYDATDTQTTTDGAGNYVFSNLIPASYPVYIRLPAGWTQTYPTSPGFGKQGYYNVAVNGGSVSGGMNFALIRPSYVSGRVYNDADGNGVQGAGEAGVPLWQIFIDSDYNGIYTPGEPYGQTDSSGNYLLTLGSYGSYNVRAVKQSGWNATAPASGVLSFYVNPGEVATGNNFGFKQGALNNAGFLNPTNFSTGEFLNPVSLATGDFNADGKQDFAAANNTGASRSSSARATERRSRHRRRSTPENRYARSSRRTSTVTAKSIW
jgi:hypothetical protein